MNGIIVCNQISIIIILKFFSEDEAWKEFLEVIVEYRKLLCQI